MNRAVNRVVNRVVTWLRRRQADPRPPERLARAVAACGYRCVECQSGEVVLRYTPADGWTPVIRHWLADGRWCPVLTDWDTAELASLDLLDALAAVTGLSSYGEPVLHLAAAA
jgi:hypothetical protein